MFTRQHYKEIANIVWYSAYKSDLNTLSRDLLISGFCNFFKKDNPRFNEKKFREACKNE